MTTFETNELKQKKFLLYLSRLDCFANSFGASCNLNKLKKDCLKIARSFYPNCDKTFVLYSYLYCVSKRDLTNTLSILFSYNND